MINRRGGATTSLILGIAGVIGVGVAGGMALTGTTPCEILSACGIKPAAKVETVAMTGDASSCPVTGAKATTVANASDSGCCPSDKAIEAAPANGVEVKVVTASQTEAKGEVCSMAASCSPANCTEGMMKACTDSGKICPQDKSATPAAQTVALADCSNDPECAVDDGVACSTKGADCHKVQPAAQTVAAPAAEAAGSCCSSGGKAAVIATATKPAAEVFVAPDAMRPLYTLQFSGKGMPMLIPASMLSASACEVKDAGSCGGGGCGEKKAAETTATTASIR